MPHYHKGYACIISLNTAVNDVGQEATDQSTFKTFNKCGTTHKQNSHNMNLGISA